MSEFSKKATETPHLKSIFYFDKNVVNIFDAHLSMLSLQSEGHFAVKRWQVFF